MLELLLLRLLQALFRNDLALAQLALPQKGFLAKPQPGTLEFKLPLEVV